MLLQLGRCRGRPSKKMQETRVLRIYCKADARESRRELHSTEGCVLPEGVHEVRLVSIGHCAVNACDAAGRTFCRRRRNSRSDDDGGPHCDTSRLVNTQSSTMMLI